MAPRLDTLATRRSILDAAERLYAMHGIDAVSNGQICREAGQRNHSAVTYHFGEKRALLRAILDRHVPGLDARRQRMLRPGLSLRALAEVLVLPLDAKLDDPSGCAFVQISAELAGHPVYALLSFDEEAPREGRMQLAQAMAAHLPAMPSEVFLARRVLLVGLLFHSLADLSRRPVSPVARAVFVSNLVDTIAAMLATPASGQTLSHLQHAQALNA